MLYKFMNSYKKLLVKPSVLFTSFQQKMLKTAFLILMCLFLITSCATSPPKKAESPKEVKIGMTEQEVKNILGEPSVISKTPDGTVIWSYRPSWKLIPDNRGTIMVEFTGEKVTKVIRVR